MIIRGLKEAVRSINTELKNCSRFDLAKIKISTGKSYKVFETNISTQKDLILFVKLYSSLKLDFRVFCPILIYKEGRIHSVNTGVIYRGASSVKCNYIPEDNLSIYSLRFRGSLITSIGDLDIYIGDYLYGVVHQEYVFVFGLGFENNIDVKSFRVFLYQGVKLVFSFRFENGSVVYRFMLGLKDYSWIPD